MTIPNVRDSWPWQVTSQKTHLLSQALRAFRPQWHSGIWRITLATGNTYVLGRQKKRSGFVSLDKHKLHRNDGKAGKDCWYGHPLNGYCWYEHPLHWMATASMNMYTTNNTMQAPSLLITKLRQQISSWDHKTQWHRHQQLKSCYSHHPINEHGTNVSRSKILHRLPLEPQTCITQRFCRAKINQTSTVTTAFGADLKKRFCCTPANASYI